MAETNYYDSLVGGTTAPTAEKSSYYQSLTATPADQARTLATNRADMLWKNRPVDSPSASAGFMPTLKSGLAPDVAGKIQFFAEARGIDPRRYGVDKEGNIGFLHPETNQWVREVPTLGNSQGPLDFTRRLGANIGASAGELAPQVAATGVGMLMGPTGMSVPAAGATAAAVDAGRQSLGSYLLGRPIMENLDLGSIAGQGTTAAAGQGASAIINNLLNRNPMGVAPYDRAKLLDPSTRAAAESLTPAQTGFKTQVLPGEATNSRSLLIQQRALGRVPETADRLGEFYTARRGDIGADLTGLLDQLSPVGSTQQGAAMLRTGAQGAIDAATTARAAEARPLYQAAVNPANVIDDATFAPVAGDPFLKRLLTKVQGDDLYGFSPDTPLGSMPIVDIAKREIDDMIEVARRTGENNRARLLIEKKNLLVGVADDAFPDYPAARAAFAGKSPEVDKLTDGVVGLAAKDVPVDKAMTAPRTLFDFRSVGGAGEVTTAKAAFEKAGKMAEWNAGLRAYLADAFAAAEKNEGGNLAKKFMDNIWQDKRAREVLEAALPPGVLPGWRSFMNVLEAAARAPAEGAATATDTLAINAMKGASGRAGNIVSGVFSPQQIGQRVGEWWSENRLGPNANRVLDALLDPAAIPKLKELRMLSPTSQKALVLTNDILTNAGVYAASPDRAPMAPPVLADQP